MKKNKVDGFIKNPRKALFKLAGPMVIAMIVQALYNVVDTAFVGRLGAESIAALTFSFPIFFILMAVNAGIGTGVNSRISRFLGAKNKTAAENTAIHGLAISLVFAVVFFLIGRSYLEQIFSLFGAEPSVAVLAVQYMSVVLLGMILMFPGHVIMNIFLAQGDTKTPTKIQVAALILNMILDPIFIYKLGYGVKGAGIATSISFAFAFILSALYLKKRSYVELKRDSFSFSKWIIMQIFKVGMPASLTMLLMSFYIGFINRFMAYFGTEYVAAFGLSARLESIAILPVIAVSMAMLTLVGMFYGAKRYDLIKDISLYGIKISVIFMIFMGALLFTFPSLFLRIFTDNQNLLQISSSYLRIIVFTMPLMAIGNPVSRILQGMGFGFPGFIISLTRIVIVSVPLAYLFVFRLGYGYLSIAAAMVIGGVASAIIAFILLEIKMKKIISS